MSSRDITNRLSKLEKHKENIENRLLSLEQKLKGREKTISKIEKEEGPILEANLEEIHESFLERLDKLKATIRSVTPNQSPSKRKKSTAKRGPKKGQKRTAEEENKEYEVEKIIDIKIENGVLFYHVVWEGYPEDEATWEPESNLGNAKKKIEEFEKTIQ